ncbi:MAG: FtsX-like permease family protein, partial [Lachnospiraceae bacterium]|nr:FtsX-like permease family protein [Lachnospiraceae bacterium]
DKSIDYTYLFPKLLGASLRVLVLLLLIAVVVIMCHSVSTGIEMEYTTLGVMKSQGFTKGRIRLILAAQYLIAQAAGAIIGVIPAVPVCRSLGNIFYPITAIIPLRRISIAKCSLIILGMLLVSGLCILFITRKIAEISPVRAISGGKREIYFDSRIKAPISKRALSASLAFRQFTSNKRQYIGVIAIVSLLVFFMMTMMVLANVISATSAWKSMGILYSDITLTFTENVEDAELTEIENMIREYSAIEDAFHRDGNYYCSIDGEEIMACPYGQPEEIPAVSKGRAPLYDNEIVITEIAADNLGLEIGDKVTIGYREKKAEYVITGLNQYMNDAGNNISMAMAAAGKLWKPSIWYAGYTLSDRSVGQEIVDVLNETYGDILTAEYEEELMEETYQLAIYAMTAVVYSFSAIFVVVVVHMVCSKAFLRERRDIGIYKALGFTSHKLRSQFAVRFLIVALIGSAIGSGLAVAFSGNMLSSILRAIGISEFAVTFRATTFAVPITMVSLCFCLFAYMASSKIKKVEVKELVVE